MKAACPRARGQDAADPDCCLPPAPAPSRSGGQRLEAEWRRVKTGGRMFLLAPAADRALPNDCPCQGVTYRTESRMSANDAERQTIADMFTRYANALDAKSWSDLDNLFVEDVTTDWLEGSAVHASRKDMV